MESLIVSLVIVVILCILFWYLVRFLPAPLQQMGRVIIVAGAVIWLLLHVRQIINAIAHT